MDQAELEERLSRIVTAWTLVFQAHAGAVEGVAGARARLIQRYSGAAYRYLLGALGDAEAADELCQEFALRVVRGDFHKANPQRGRFRNYLRTALIHLVTDYHRSRQGWPQALGDADPPALQQTGDTEQQFLANWREELLHRTWKALADVSPAYYAVLQARIEMPDLSSAQLADHLAKQLGKPMTAANVRKTLERAHARFADLLLDEVAVSLESTDVELVRKELVELNLLKYCEASFQRRRSELPS